MGFSIITYKAQSTTWNGTSWSNGVPKDNTDVVIAGNYNSAANLSVRNFTINEGSVFTINSNYRLTIYGNFINNGTIVVNNDAALIQTNNESTYSGFGTAIIRKEANLKQKDYNYWCSPVIGQNLYNFSIGTPTDYFFRYKESNDRFETTGLNSLSIFEQGVGYAIRGKSSYSPTTPTKETFTFNGIPNNGRITVTLKKSVGVDKGYNLVGNPYPSNLSFKAFATGLNKNVIFNKQWLWTNLNEVKKQQGSAYAGNNYATYVALVGGVGPTYVSNSIEEIALRPKENTKVGQGFIVQAKYDNAVLIFKNDMRSLSASNSVFYNKSEVEGDEEDPEEEVVDRYWLKIVNSDNIANNILIAHIAEATNNYDEDYDAALFTMGNDAFYSAVGTNKLQIQARAFPISDSDVIPLAYKTSKAGNCIIALNDKDGVFKDSNKAIYLKDKVTGTVTNLQEGYYTFNSEVLTTPNDSRFEILYANEVLAAGAVTKEDLLVYKQNETLVIKNNFNISKAELYDASGKLMTSLSGNNTKEIKLSTIGFVKGVYILKITSEKGITAKKVIL